ncbi:MAG: tyrosine-protein phosphatase, partial [Anaeroplasmataceae bacterium]|nr:tyrosine-protein phosphatase [Anaeroplasmataceae bacterium]
HIKSHMLLRSDALCDIKEEDINLLTSKYQLKRVIDLRCENESEDKPDIRIDGVELILNPILPREKVGISKKGDAKTDFTDFVKTLHENGIESSNAFMNKIYEEVINSTFSKNAYQNFFKILLKPVEGATLWHCSAGKDRAGFATILLLAALDFDKEVIVSDYLATNQFYEKSVLEMKAQLGDFYEEILWCVFGVKQEFIDTIFETIDKNYGGMDAYLEILGISSKEKEQLKKLYLEV